MQLDGTETGEEGGTDLTVLQLADGVLENINKCPECSKPILQSAIEEHSGVFSSLFPPFALAAPY